MDKLISIVVPVYNIEHYLPRCLDSILKQTYPNIEVILVNDGSTDGSGAVLERYAQLNSNLYVIHKKNAGVSQARIDGIMEAKGEYIGFVDGDDEIEPDMYQRLYDNLVRADADISHCGHQVIRKGKPVEYLYNTGKFMIQGQVEALTDLLRGSFEPGLCNKLFRKALLQDLLQSSRMDTTVKINEDLLMNYYLFKSAQKIVYEDFCPYHYMKREASASCSYSLRHIWDPIKVRQIILDECMESELDTIARAAYVNALLNVYHGLIEPKRHRTEKEKIFQLLRQNSEDIRYLSPSRARQVRLLLRAPRVYDFIRKVYGKLR